MGSDTICPYEGYEIIDECQLPSIAYGIRGTGSNWYKGVAPDDPPRMDALDDLGTDLLTPALETVDSLGGIGIGTSCTDRAGVSIILSDWRDVDRVFSLASGVLKEYDLQEEISLFIMSGEAQ